MEDNQTPQEIAERTAKKTVEANMKLHQAQILKMASENTVKILQDKFLKNLSSSFLNKIDDEIDKSKAYDNHIWQNKINKSNFDALRQVEQMWERTERYVDALEVDPEQGELKKGALNFIKEGKNFTHERLKVIRFADRDGWSAALNFLADDIAQDEKEEKRMKKGRKDAENSKNKEGKGRATGGNERRGASQYQLTSPSRGSYASFGQQGGARRQRDEQYEYRRESDGRECYICGQLGHVARACYRRHRR